MHSFQGSSALLVYDAQVHDVHICDVHVHVPYQGQRVGPRYRIRATFRGPSVLRDFPSSIPGMNLRIIAYYDCMHMHTFTPRISSTMSRVT